MFVIPADFGKESGKGFDIGGKRVYNKIEILLGIESFAI